MNIRYMNKTIALLVGMILFLLCNMFTTGQVFAAGTTGFSDDDTTEANQSNWMGYISDTQTLSQLSIPGTHYSMAHYGSLLIPQSINPTQKVTQTQSMPLSQQLQAGIRYLDIRVKPKEATGTFDIYHGPFYQYASFDDVMNIVTDFLKYHSTETILMRVKEEKDGTSSPTFETIFTKYWDKYRNYLVKPTSNNPKLGDVRGKIVILQDFQDSKEDQTFGIPYYSLNIQDNFKAVDGAKYRVVEDHLLKANKDTNNMYLNHFSTNGITNAGQIFLDNTSPKAQAKYINDQFWVYMQLPAKYMNNTPKEYIEHTGIIAMDFASSGTVSMGGTSDSHLRNVGLIDIIISKNSFNRTRPAIIN